MMVPTSFDRLEHLPHIHSMTNNSPSLLPHTNTCASTNYGEMVYWWMFIPWHRDDTLVVLSKCPQAHATCLIPVTQCERGVFQQPNTCAAGYKVNMKKAKWRWHFICAGVSTFTWFHTCGAGYLLWYTGYLFCTDNLVWSSNLVLYSDFSSAVMKANVS